MSLLIIKTKQVSWQGVHQPEGDLIAYNNDILVIKVPGHSYWVGRFMEQRVCTYGVSGVLGGIGDNRHKHT